MEPLAISTNANDALIMVKGTGSFRDQLSQSFDSIPADQSLPRLIQVLRNISDGNEQLEELAAEAWKYIVANRLWEAGYESLEELKSDLDFQHTLMAIIKRHEDTRARKDIEIAGVTKNWGCSPQQAIPASIYPHWPSVHFLRSLNQLSKICSLGVANSLFGRAIIMRLERPKASKEEILQPTDIRDIITSVQSLNNAADDALNSLFTADGSDQSNNSANQQPDPREQQDKQQPKQGQQGWRSNEQEVLKGRKLQIQKQESTSKSSDGSLGNPDSSNEGGSQDKENSEQNLKLLIGSEPQQQPLGPTPPIVKSAHHYSKSLTSPCQTSIQKNVRFTSINSTDDPDPSCSETSESDTIMKDAGDDLKDQTPSCFCSLQIQQRLDSIYGLLGDEEGLLLIRIAINSNLDNLCHTHLRKLAKSSVGLKNNFNRSRLIHRLSLVYRHARRLTHMRASYPDWFIKSCRPAGVKELSLYRYQPVPHHASHLDSPRILERFAGPGSWEKWEKEGTLIIPDVFAYLNEPDILQMIDQEFSMYQHHSILKSDRPRQGWCRNMYYSLIQQLVRQDPVWYALCAALQGSSELIAYPYIAKDAIPGEKTGFLHLDINVGQYLKSDNNNILHLLSSSLSLDHESAQGCTVLVPGFHHHIKDWFLKVVARGQSSTGFTTNCSSTYNKEDQETWGKPQPTPCSAFSLRITRPDIIHGSTNQAPTRRRTLFAWYKALDDDHNLFKGTGKLTWSDVAACHRDLMIPSEEPSGQQLKHPLPKESFPGAVALPSLSYLGDALIGRRKWKDPWVMVERERLLGKHHKEACCYVEHTRKNMVEQYRKHWYFMKENEKIQFGENSFFNRTD